MILDDQLLVDRFLDMMAAEAGASRHTLAAYRNDLERAAECCGSLGSATTEELSRLGAEWSGLAPSTVARRSAALRRFFGFLLDDGLRSDDPSAALPRPRFERPLPRILEADEVDRMFEAAEERAVSGELAALRNLARLELLRVGLAGDRAGQPAARRGAARAAVPGGPRERLQGAPGADLVACRDGGREVAGGR